MVEAAQAGSPGLLDLEKELTCSICTEILYQPLTLLDCLHTFCGSCLKEWFSWQATKASPSKPNPFNCPSCRAPVRETRPDAKVTTLLDMYLQANPTKARSDLEKEETKKHYKPGDNVLPKSMKTKESHEESEDRRMIEEAREMSLRDVGIRGPGSYERGIRHRARDAVRDSRAADNARQRVGNERRGREDENSRSGASRSQARQIEHQSSLRSLLSNSDLNSSALEEEILRQIMDEGILDGIDLNNIDVSQEDELSEKIADAYRRRHGQRQRSRDSRNERSTASASRNAAPPSNQRQERRADRSPITTERASNLSHPPVSRPRLLEAYPTARDHRRRTTSETRRQTSPVPSTGSRASGETQRQAARSATDLSSGPQSYESSHRGTHESSNRERRNADSERLRPRGVSRDHPQQEQPSRATNERLRRPSENASVQRPSVDIKRPQTTAATTNSSTEALNASQDTPLPRNQVRPIRRMSTTAPEPAAPQPELPFFPEPSISCDRCGRPGLEYELHEHCSQCNNGQYNLCLRCYRVGQGCLHWYGFGFGAIPRYERQAPPSGYPPNHQFPHRLTGHCYLKPTQESQQQRSNESQNLMTTSNPAQRLQSGPFCSNCSTYAPDCFWKCDICNDGEWGFCNPCVNQGKCCTHALLPVALTSHLQTHKSPPSTPSSHATTTSFTPVQSSPTMAHNLQSSDPLLSDQHTPLTFSTKCDICTYPIPPSTTRFHCPTCNAGDYDICTSCYLKLASRGTINHENSHKGWRRCPNGHRMIVVGFQDSEKGQRRIVVEDLVGGHALKEQDDSPGAAGARHWSWRDEDQTRQARSVSRSVANTNTPPGVETKIRKYFPNGGVGMRVQALWGYWPQEGVRDELAFPKGAEVGECEDINGDWFFGHYCGRAGVFPGGYGRVVGVVGT